MIKGYAGPGHLLPSKVDITFHLISTHPKMKYIIVGANCVSNSEMMDFFAELGRIRLRF